MRNIDSIFTLLKMLLIIFVFVSLIIVIYNRNKIESVVLSDIPVIAETGDDCVVAAWEWYVSSDESDEIYTCFKREIIETGCNVHGNRGKFISFNDMGRSFLRWKGKESFSDFDIVGRCYNSEGGLAIFYKLH